MQTVKGSQKVDEIDVQWGVPFYTLLDDIPQSEDLIYATPSFPKTCLFLPQLLVNSGVNSAE